MAKAKLKRLDYTSHLEMLGERFHASPALLHRLNPRLRVAAGEQIVVPNVQVVPDAESKPVPGIVVRVSKAESTLTVLRRRRQGDHACAGDEWQRARPAADRLVDGHRGRAQPDVQLQPRSVLGRRPVARESDNPARPEQSRRRGVDRHQQAALRHSRHARARRPWATPRRTVACASPTGTRCAWPRWSARARRWSSSSDARRAAVRRRRGSRPRRGWDFSPALA